jgi:enamine deaminase RidA (YjgF/YER057c/UK114 family)
VSTAPDTALATSTFRQPDSVTLAVVRLDGSTAYASGQVAIKDGELLAVGLLGTDVDIATGQLCAWQCAHNVLAALRDAIGSLDRVQQVVRLGVYVASADGFTDQPLVAHGASQLMLDVFGPQVGSHARTALGVKALPLGTPVEVDAVFRIKD